MTKELSAEVGDLLRTARIARGDSRMDVANKCDISTRTIRSLENHSMNRRMSYLTYLKVRDYLTETY